MKQNTVILLLVGLITCDQAVNAIQTQQSISSFIAEADHITDSEGEDELSAEGSDSEDGSENTPGESKDANVQLTN